MTHPSTDAPGASGLARRVTTALHNPERRPARAERDAAADATLRILELQRATLNALTVKTTELVELLTSQALNGVLETATDTFDAGGTITRDYRVPFAAVMISNTTGATVIVTNGTRQAQAPGRGTGIFVVRDGIAATFPIVGNNLTIYGTAGQACSFVVLARPITAPTTGPA